MTYQIGPIFMTGKNVSLASVSPESVTYLGDATQGSVLDIKALGVYDTFEFDGTLNSEEIHSADSTVANYQAKFDDWTITIGAIDLPDGSNPLKTIFASTMFYRVAVAATPKDYSGGTPSQGNATVAIGIRDTIKYGYIEGKNVTMITMKPVGVPVYVGVYGSAPF